MNHLHLGFRFPIGDCHDLKPGYYYCWVCNHEIALCLSCGSCKCSHYGVVVDMVMPGERHYWNVQEWPLEVLQRQSDIDMEHGAHTIHVHYHPKGEECIEQCFTKEIGNNQEA